MTRLRAAKIDGIAATVAPLEVDDPDGDAEVLVLGWGSTYGPIAAAARSLRAQGFPVAQAHLRHLNPFPANTGEVLTAYRHVIVPEMNLGQLSHAAARDRTSSTSSRTRPCAGCRSAPPISRTSSRRQ